MCLGGRSKGSERQSRCNGRKMKRLESGGPGRMCLVRDAMDIGKMEVIEGGDGMNGKESGGHGLLIAEGLL